MSTLFYALHTSRDKKKRSSALMRCGLEEKKTSRWISIYFGLLSSPFTMLKLFPVSFPKNPPMSALKNCCEYKFSVLLFGFLANRHWNEIDCSLSVCLHLNDCSINTTKTNIKKFSSCKPIWKSLKDCNPKENLVSNKFSMKNRLSWCSNRLLGH